MRTSPAIQDAVRPLLRVLLLHRSSVLAQPDSNVFDRLESAVLDRLGGHCDISRIVHRGLASNFTSVHGEVRLSELIDHKVVAIENLTRLARCASTLERLRQGLRNRRVRLICLEPPFDSAMNEWAELHPSNA